MLIQLVVLVIIASVIVVAWRQWKLRGGNRMVANVVQGYGLLVVVFLALYILMQDSFDGADALLMWVTAPWSFLSELAPLSFMQKLGSRWWGGIVYFVLFCGGLNSVILYFAVSVGYVKRRPADAQSHQVVEKYRL